MIWQAVLLGLVQGLGEFLPISSSGHLVLVPWLFKFQDPGVGFDVALHLATLAAVLLYFKDDVIALIKAAFRMLNPKTRDIQGDVFQKLAILLIVGSIPAAIVGKLLDSLVENKLRSPLLVAFNLVFFGLLLLYFEKKSVPTITVTDQLTTKTSFKIGLWQSIALLPGVSRSGVSITGALFEGVSKQLAARFSFLLSIPVILGAGILKLPEIGSGVSLAYTLAGSATALLSGLLAISFFMRFIQTKTFKPFVIYRLLLAGVILILYFTKM